MSHFYFDYDGNKRTETKYCDFEISNIETIVEPFCGSCGYSLNQFIDCNKRNLKYVINDIDRELIEFLNEIRCKGSKPFYEYMNKYDFKNVPDKEIIKVLNKDYKENQNPYSYFMKRRCRISIRRNKRLETYKTRFIKGDYNDTDEFFKKCEISCGDYGTIFDKYKNDEKALLFIDPPYFDTYNMSYSLDKGDNTKIYIDILELLQNGKCKVIFITKKNALMAYVFKDYIKCSYNKCYQRNKTCVEHIVVSNIKYGAGLKAPQ